MKERLEDKFKVGIYAVVNKLNGKLYIGKSKNIYKRIIDHKCGLNKKSKDENRHLINSWHKYGKENFDYYVVEYLILDEVLIAERELFWIKKLNTLDRDKGYNLRLDSDTKMIVNEETKKLMSIAMTKYYENNPERKLIDAKRATKFWKDNPEKRKIMSSRVSKATTRYTIIQYDSNMNPLREFLTQKGLKEECPEFTLSCILSVCNGYKRIHKGFFWRYRCVKTRLIIQPNKKY